MARSPLLPVEDALARILATASEPLEAETVPLADSLGRRLAADLAACRTQPPCAVSAMDGYAVRAADIATVPARLRVIGASAAGHGFRGCVGPGEAVRIFTGAPVPEGADAILIQEDARAENGDVTALASEPPGRYVRRAGLDFSAGDVLLKAGRRMGPSEMALAAAMNQALAAYGSVIALKQTGLPENQVGTLADLAKAALLEKQKAADMVKAAARNPVG